MIIADNNSGLEDSSIILKARKVTIERSGPINTTVKVTRLENKNLSKILFVTLWFLIVFTIFLTYCCKFTSIFYHV